jgi:hypothetical protein
LFVQHAITANFMLLPLRTNLERYKGMCLMFSTKVELVFKKKKSPKISVQIMMLIKILLPHIVGLKQEAELKSDVSTNPECCVVE